MTPRVLVFCGDRYHPADVVMDGLASTFGNEVTFERAPDGTPGVLDPGLAAIIIAKSNARSPSDAEPLLTDEVDRAIESFVQSGKGLFVIHSGIVGFPAGTAVRALTGGAFVHHPETCDVTVRASDAIVFGADSEDFVIFDEHYFVELDETKNVFLESQSVNGTQPAGWYSKSGKGRVCVVTPGHLAGVWSNESYKRLLRACFSWVTGG